MNKDTNYFPGFYSIENKVLESSNYVNSNQIKKVTINEEKIAEHFKNFEDLKFPKWSECHKININEIDMDNLISFILCIDAVNFCFWPYNDLNKGDFEYDDLVNSFRYMLPLKFSSDETDISKNHYSKISNFYNPDFLVTITKETLLKFEMFPSDFPLLEERARSLRELGNFMLSFKSSSDILKETTCCLKIAGMLVQNISTFRDESFYNEKQVFLYKRCQIAAADLYSAIKEKNIILENSEKLTMFPDYRVPQILNEMGIMVYDKDLTEIVKNKIKIKANSDEEIEIRLMTIYAVEKIKNYINKNGGNLKSIEIDYILWNEGEKMRKEIIPHHRTLTIFY